MAQLSNASSIVDFLKSRGFAPSAGERIPLFEQRKKIFEQLGLQKQLGQFRGTSTQNPALLQSLGRLEREMGVKISPTNIGDVLKAGIQPRQAPQLAQPVQQEEPLRFETAFAPPQGQQFPQQQPPPPQQQNIVPSQQIESQQQIQQPLPQQEQPQMPSQLREAALALFKQPTQQELSKQALTRFTGSSEFGFAQEEAQVGKERIQQQAKQQAEGLISQLASRGLIFSGKKTKGLEAIEADKLANLLNIDRNFAVLISKGLETSAQQIAKEAQAGSKQALEALNVLGYGINPLTGGIEPTLQARQLGRQEEQQRLQEERFQQQEARKAEETAIRQQQFEQTQERLQQQAETQQQRFEAQQELAQARLDLSEAKNVQQQKLAQQKLDKAVKKIGQSSVTVSIAGTSKQKAATIMNSSSTLTLTDIPINERAGVAAELNKLKSQALKVGDIYGVMKASAGGKAASESFVNSFERAATVLSQLGTLQNSIGGEATGPIINIWRSNNPYDVKAQQIKAQLTSIVPMLARGVYGEVGVLTDNDIKLYSQTLPNMGSVEALRNAILGITLKSVQRSLENKIKVASGLGKDMSGISDVYKELQTESDRILASINAGAQKKPIQTKVQVKGKEINMSKYFK